MAKIVTKKFGTEVKGKHLNQEFFNRISYLKDDDLNQHDFYRVSPINEGLSFSGIMPESVLVLFYNSEPNKSGVVIVRKSQDHCPVSYTGRQDSIDEVIGGLEDLSEIRGERINLKEWKPIKWQT